MCLEAWPHCYTKIRYLAENKSHHFHIVQNEEGLTNVTGLAKTKHTHTRKYGSCAMRILVPQVEIVQVQCLSYSCQRTFLLTLSITYMGYT